MKKNSIKCVYKITNLINNKIYIGVTIDFVKRKQQHLNPKNDNFPIRKAVLKYGKNNFIIQPLIILNNYNTLLNWEKFYIAVYNSNNPEYGYNCTLGGEGTQGIIYKHRRLKIYQYSLSKELINTFSCKEEVIQKLGFVPHFIEEGSKSCHGFLFTKNKKLVKDFDNRKLGKNKKVCVYNVVDKTTTYFSSIKELREKLDLSNVHYYLNTNKLFKKKFILKG